MGQRYRKSSKFKARLGPQQATDLEPQNLDFCQVLPNKLTYLQAPRKYGALIALIFLYVAAI